MKHCSRKLDPALAESAETAEFAGLLRSLTGMQMALYGPDGVDAKVYTDGGGGSPLCRVIRSTPEGERRCADCNRAHFALAARRRRELSYLCHAGLIDFAVPIRIGGQHVATISCGQILPEAPGDAGLRKFLHRNKSLELDAAAVRAAYFRSPHLPADKVAAAMQLFSHFAGSLGRAAWRSKKLEKNGDCSVIVRAKRHIASRLPDCDLGLESTARHVGLSAAYFSDLFHRATGTRFCRFVQEARIREAKSALRKTTLPVTQVAYDCGFRSHTHFDRVFRQIAGCSPSQFRQRTRRRPADASAAKRRNG